MFDAGVKKKHYVLAALIGKYAPISRTSLILSKQLKTRL
jgi:hypothetical protein